MKGRLTQSVAAIVALALIVVALLIAFRSPAQAAAVNPVSVLTPRSKFWNGNYLGAQKIAGTHYQADIREGKLAIFDLAYPPEGVGREVARVSVGIMPASNLLVQGNRIYLTGRSLCCAYAADGWQVWDVSRPESPAFVYGWSLHAEEVMTSLTVLGESVYVTAYGEENEFVETGRTHTVSSGETLWGIARDELCGGGASCAYQRWPELLGLNPEIPVWTDSDGVSIALIYPGEEIKVASSRYEKTYHSVLFRYERVDGVLQLLATRRSDFEKYEVVFPDARFPSDVSLWTTDVGGRDHQYVLDGKTLKVDPNAKGD